MESGGGSREPCPECGREVICKMDCSHYRLTSAMVREAVEKLREQRYGPQQQVSPTLEEQQRIADGEPYCFRCGKPASSFSEYASNLEECQSVADYVREDEGTYNPETNRFACDGCYIAIGMPAGLNGWQAP